jgi:c-di-GMP-binding flagellar brake protein YcgR
MSTDNRRTEERVPVDFQVECLHEGDYLLSFSKNISLGGMFLCTETPPEPGSKLTLVFPVEKYYQAEVLAIVVWVNKFPGSRENGMGVQFLSPLPPHLKDEIIKNVKRVEILKEFEGFA